MESRSNLSKRLGTSKTSIDRAITALNLHDQLEQDPRHAQRKLIPDDAVDQVTAYLIDKHIIEPPQQPAADSQGAEQGAADQLHTEPETASQAATTPHDALIEMYERMIAGQKEAYERTIAAQQQTIDRLTTELEAAHKENGELIARLHSAHMLQARLLNRLDAPTAADPAEDQPAPVRPASAAPASDEAARRQETPREAQNAAPVQTVKETPKAAVRPAEPTQDRSKQQKSRLPFRFPFGRKKVFY